jgi:hypothetical protein
LRISISLIAFCTPGGKVKAVGAGGLVESQEDVWSINLYKDTEMVADKPLTYHAPKLILWYASHPLSAFLLSTLLTSTSIIVQGTYKFHSCLLAKCVEACITKIGSGVGGGQIVESGTWIKSFRCK